MPSSYLAHPFVLPLLPNPIADTYGSSVCAHNWAPRHCRESFNIHERQPLTSQSSTMLGDPTHSFSHSPQLLFHFQRATPSDIHTTITPIPRSPCLLTEMEPMTQHLLIIRLTYYWPSASALLLHPVPSSPPRSISPLGFRSHFTPPSQTHIINYPLSLLSCLFNQLLPFN